jgi:LemA protein
MSLALVILIAAAALIGLAVLLIYNRMVSRRNAVDNSWAQIEAALKRRHDLIPNLVEAVKGYAKHEQQTFEDVTKARSGAVAAEGDAPPKAAGAEDLLGAAIGRLMVVAEQYPELRATENFQQLQGELSETENQIQITRRVYNDTVQTYNTMIQIFPNSVIANAFGFDARLFYEADAGDRATPEVSFAKGEAAPPAAEK